MLSVEQLRRALTWAEGKARVTEWMTALGFETTGWMSGRIQRTILELAGLLMADFSEVVADTVEFGFNSFATGDPLTEFSRSRFQNERSPATHTVGPMRLRSTSSIPHTILPGQLLAATDANVQYRNVTGGTLPAGSAAAPSSIPLTWRAVLAGETGNAPLNTVRRLLTPIAGVTVLNDEGDPWYTETGTDEEPDSVLRRRNETKWASLTVELVRESYENIALSAGARKVRVVDNHPRGPGTIDVVCAAETAPLGDAGMASIQLEMSRRAFQTDIAWPADSGSRVAVVGPSPAELDVSATLYHDPNVSGVEAEARARIALTDFLRRTPIGGWTFASGLANVVTPEQIVEVLKGVAGVTAVKLASPSMNVSVGTLSLVMEGTWAFTMISVEN